MIYIRSIQFVAILILFIIITFLVHFRFLQSVDYYIFNTIDKFNPDQYLRYSLVIIASLGEVINLIFVGIIFTLIRRTRKMGMVLMITIMLITIAVSYMKPLVAQSKPPESQRLPVLPQGFNLESDSLMTFARDFSYPSNHTSSITAFTYIVGSIIGQKSKKYSYIIWMLPLMLTLSNLLLELNYLNDLIGGFLLGLIISITTSNILKLDVPFTMNKFKNK